MSASAHRCPLAPSTAMVRTVRTAARSKVGRVLPAAARSTGDSGDIGTRIRFIRRQRRMTLDQLAGATGLTKSYLSKVERGLSVPSISTALKVAASFRLTVGHLAGEEPSPGSICVTRERDRKSFMHGGGHAGYDYQAIAAAKASKSMEPFIMRPPLTFQDNRRFQHGGEEFIFVLSGAIEIQFPKRKIALGAGDAIYFDAHIPHRSRSLGGQPAEALVVVKS
ncbi:MAG: helix-turn-helix domain-containing protein [Acetobacteraceae bacterium]